MAWRNCEFNLPKELKDKLLDVARRTAMPFDRMKFKTRFGPHCHMAPFIEPRSVYWSKDGDPNDWDLYYGLMTRSQIMASQLEAVTAMLTIGMEALRLAQRYANANKDDLVAEMARVDSERTDAEARWAALAPGLPGAPPAGTLPHETPPDPVPDDETDDDPDDEQPEWDYPRMDTPDDEPPAEPTPRGGIDPERDLGRGPLS